MSELRYSLISRDWVIIASERAKRPEDFKKAKPDSAPVPEYKADCPFCPGKEAVSGVETFRIGDAKGWRVRSIYNKYPALSPDQNLERSPNSFHNHISGFGDHEVIVETS